MDEIILVALTGLVLGLEHALEPDHLVAVSVFASERKDMKAVLLLGMTWGLGHTTTLLIVGGGALLLNITISDQLASFMELLVGLSQEQPDFYLYRLYTKRCQEFLYNPPSDNWKGIFSHVTK